MPVPTEAMAEEAQRGLDWRREFGRGGTEVGIARARDISNRRDLSMDTVRRMASYFARHEVDKEAEGFRPGEDGYPSNGRIAWALWSGDPGKAWANKILDQEDSSRSIFLSHLSALLASEPDTAIRSFLSDYIISFNLMALRAGSKFAGDKIFIPAASQVFSRINWFEMPWIDARSVATEMVNVLSIGDWANTDLIAEAMGWNEFFASPRSAQDKVTIPGTSFCPDPIPASVLALALINLTPETIFNTHSRHFSPLLDALPTHTTCKSQKKDTNRVETRPYEGEHAARINEPEKYDSFSRVNDEGGQGVDFVYGILPDGGVEIQSIRFDADVFTVDEAQAWLERNDFEPLKFEPAVGSSERTDNVLHSVQIMGASMAEREVRSRLEGAEIRAEEGEIRVSGYAAVFGEETNIGGMFTEVIERGAFKSAIERQDDVVFLINHDGLPLARTRSGTLMLQEDERGLYMEASLDMEDPDVRSIVPKMKRGDLDKMSFAFIPDRQEWDDSGDMPKRMIKDLRLYDVSIVTTPAYEGTEIGLRSLEQHRKEQTKNQAARRLRMKARL